MVKCDSNQSLTISITSVIKVAVWLRTKAFGKQSWVASSCECIELTCPTAVVILYTLTIKIENCTAIDTETFATIDRN